ncbi:hypothetical protein Q4F19_03520 [Sphingomonas sp. BIUV-7]|uniref:Uncharacterized protein n=1 Tax=Sphingomonas natans TaxID=3063330 RepID=A0ABT8Y6A0_9SPHN|nr:hypothetical protein [Sphingomonas sp. BIUV-7]MDO6413443.1 hypothetical protein [Sphingomonas sp. BIUV-7]
MTSISGSMSAASMMSPSDRMKLALQSAVSAGTVKSTDQSALSGALDDIDAAMKSSGPPSAGVTPGGMKTKMDSLIDNEVADGKLTDDQATELKQVFANAAGSMKGAHGPHGPPPPSPDDSDDDPTTTATTSTGSTDSTKSAIEQMIAFLQKLEDSMTSTSPYTSSGSSTASGSTASSVLINAVA